MQSRNLGSSGLLVSPICLGTMTFGSPVGEADSIKLIHAAMDRGINFNDTANQPKAAVGEQDVRFGQTRIWVLPNPSGLNAHFQIKELAALFREPRIAAEKVARPS